MLDIVVQAGSINSSIIRFDQDWLNQRLYLIVPLNWLELGIDQSEYIIDSKRLILVKIYVCYYTVL